MKLVDILARHLNKWPEPGEKIAQDDDHYICSYPEDDEIKCVNGDWKCNSANPLEKIELAHDFRTAIVTEAEWQAAVDALKADSGPAIDWSIQPAGFPLWLEGVNENHKKHSGWYRENGLVFEGENGGQWRSSREGQFFTVHRKPDDHCDHSHGNDQGCPECGEEFAPSWSGEGLPPVGTVCEFAGGTPCPYDPFDKDLKEGMKVTIIAHIKSGDFTLAAFTFDPVNPDRGMVQVEQGNFGCFRPIRTPEQIAADEREKAIDLMIDDAGVPVSPDARIVMKTLYLCGYRKQVTE